MAQLELKMPKLGESITEATITKWLKNPGDKIELDDPILEIATDKVDSEIPSPEEGTLVERKYQEGDVVAVGEIIAIIETGEAGVSDNKPEEETKAEVTEKPEEEEKQSAEEETEKQEEPQAASTQVKSYDQSGRFYSPLVRSIAKEENIPMEELSEIPGTGQDERLTKNDLIEYLKTRGKASTASYEKTPAAKVTTVKAPDVKTAQGDKIVEMGRMRKLIAEHMVMSEDTSVHINLFAEADMSKLVTWRNHQKDSFRQRYNEKLTFTPLFIEAISKALRDFPMVNVSVAGDKIIMRSNINIGMAAATPEGNLIVPVIKNADHKSLLGISREVNDLARRARNNQLKPDEIQGGTFTLTNFGIFGLTSGTPIINQPQVAILGVGAIIKKPVVIESPQGDTIGIRPVMTLTLACDHRVIDGALGGQFLQRLVHYLENFDTSQSI